MEKRFARHAASTTSYLSAEDVIMKLKAKIRERLEEAARKIDVKPLEPLLRGNLLVKRLASASLSSNGSQPCPPYVASSTTRRSGVVKA